MYAYFTLPLTFWQKVVMKKVFFDRKAQGIHKGVPACQCTRVVQHTGSVVADQGHRIVLYKRLLVLSSASSGYRCVCSIIIKMKRIERIAINRRQPPSLWRLTRFPILMSNWSIG